MRTTSTPTRAALSRTRAYRPLAVIGAIAAAVTGGSLGSLRADRAARAALSGVASAPAGGITEMTVNGQRFLVVAGSTRRPLSEVLDSFAERCRSQTADIVGWPAHLGRVGPMDATPGSYPQSRQEGVGVGAVTCLYLGRQSPQDSQKVIDDIAATLQLPLGVQSRHLYAWTAPSGATAYALTWNPGPLDLAAMAPEEGDVAGLDLGSIPRPGGSRRIADSRSTGSRQRLVTFVSSGADVADLKAAYRRTLGGASWATFDAGDDALAVRRGRRMVWLHFDEGEAPGTVLTTMVEDSHRSRRTQ